MTGRVSRILVVEDEAVVLYTLELILKQHGYEVKGAADGATALAAIETFQPDILLCDINLPDTDGIQLALQLKSSLPRCRIILLSGEITSSDLLDEAKSHGYYFEVMAKPADPEQLLQLLARPEGTPRDPSGIHRVK